MNTLSKTISLRLADPYALVDGAVGLLVEGCEPLADVVVEASIDSGDCTYVSRARFQSDAQGRVDTAVQASLAGTYTGVDPFGLWWSGECVASARPAPLLASCGFASLAISYFGAPNLPPDLVGIEVEVVERAVDWLLRQTGVERRIGVMGISRGSELAMLAGALLESVDAVVAFAPSGVVWSGLDQRGPVDVPAWTFRGQPLPYAMTGGLPGRLDPREAFALRPLFDETLHNQAMIESAEIPVERLRGPLLLVSGGADAMWPSTPMAKSPNAAPSVFVVGSRLCTSGIRTRVTLEVGRQGRRW